MDLEGEEDLISNLPDETLIHILSFLTTKESFRTSILSSRWGNLWTFVPNLVFCPNGSWGDWADDPRYMDFIERAVLSHNCSINKFKVQFTSLMDISRLSALISHVVERNVQYINITHSLNTTNRHLGGTLLQLPESLFTCKTLVTLKLKTGLLRLVVPDSINFPCLKVFHISVCFPSNNLTQKLFCSSPALEELRIGINGDFGQSMYNITSPSLKKLYVAIRLNRFRDPNHVSVVNIDAPVLESFKVMDGYLIHYILKNSPALAKTHVSLDVFRMNDLKNPYLIKNFSMLMKSVSNVMELSLTRGLPMVVCPEVKWPIFANVNRLKLEFDYGSSLSFSKWPAFPKLKHLTLFVDNDLASKNLSDLLEFMPHLVSLVFVKKWCCSKLEKFNYLEQNVPSCFQYCLREIELRMLKGLESELHLIIYLLLNAQVLEKMSVELLVSLYKPPDLEKFKSAIKMMPRCSKDAEIIFI